MLTDKAERNKEITKEWKRDTDFIDTAGIKDAAGVSLKLTRIADGRLFTPVGEEYVKQVKTTKIRPDDVIICGYPKTGCHWVWETVTMILRGKAEHSRMGKTEAMLELVAPEVPEALPSPRVLNTHMEYGDLPQQAVAGKNKLIFTLRNPKDVAVSLYNHHYNLKHLYDYNGKFNDWFPLYMEGKVDFGTYLDYHLSWEKAIHDHPDHPVLIVKYEDLIEDLPSGVRRLTEFLGITLSDDQIQEIAEASDIDHMRKHFEDIPIIKPVLRKGKVGDWKNWLTVAQSEMIDEKWGEQLKETKFCTRDVLNLANGNS